MTRIIGFTRCVLPGNDRAAYRASLENANLLSRSVSGQQATPTRAPRTAQLSGAFTKHSTPARGVQQTTACPVGLSDLVSTRSSGTTRHSSPMKAS